MMRSMPAMPPGRDPVRGAAGVDGDGSGPANLTDLLRASARGDEDAFARLYDATSARLFGLVLRVVRDPAQSEEVTQEAFLDIWRTCARFDPSRGSAIGWLLTVAHRKAVDRVRSAQASTEREQHYGARARERSFDVTSEAAEQSLDAQRVRRALASLTETQRGALELAYFGGYTHTEVAALLGVPLGTAKTRIRDGLIRLRDTMGMQP